jgi:peptidoglycan/LPS O-acetylase OafA/YrhL
MSEAGYIKSLDGLRAIAILLVMTFHAELTHFGWIGVQFFFVLSGYLITGILWKEKFKNESLAFKFKKFWVRRSLRIFPLYYGYLLAIGICYLILNFPSYFGVFFPYAITYTANFPLALLHKMGNPLFNHLWSLSIEEQFYFLFPLIILLIPRRFVKYFLLAVIFISPILRFLFGEYYKSRGLNDIIVSNGVNFNTLCQLDAFCVGGIIPVLSLDARIRRPMNLFWPAAAIAVAAGVINYLVNRPSINYLRDLGYYHYDINGYQHVWYYTCLNMVFATFLLSLVSLHRPSSSHVRTFLESQWMTRIGKVSYGMYIFHWFIWVYFFANMFRPERFFTKGLLFVPYVLTVYLVAELSYRFYEAPFIKLKDKFFPPALMSRQKIS